MAGDAVLPVHTTGALRGELLCHIEDGAGQPFLQAFTIAVVIVCIKAPGKVLIVVDGLIDLIHWVSCQMMKAKDLSQPWRQLQDFLVSGLEGPEPQYPGAWLPDLHPIPSCCDMHSPTSVMFTPARPMCSPMSVFTRARLKDLYEVFAVTQPVSQSLVNCMAVKTSNVSHGLAARHPVLEAPAMMVTMA